MICSSLNRLPFIVRLLSVTDSTLFWRNFRGSGHDRHDITFKKNAAPRRPAEQDRHAVAAERAMLKAEEPKLDAPGLVFMES